MAERPIYTIDLNFMGIPGAIASYFIPHRRGGVLVECGSGSTQLALQEGLEILGYSLEDISDVLLTHIHLDHAGAAGWLAEKGVRIHVHLRGAPHMLNPVRLLDSAGRIYGDMMETLWGAFLPVKEEMLFIVQDNDVIEIEDLQFLAIDTPGHANYRPVFILEDICFCGDIGGVRLAGLPHLRLPMPPPEFHPGKWRASLNRLKQENFKRIAPTHFGIYTDTGWHLNAIAQALDDVERWMMETLPDDPTGEALTEQFFDWSRKRSIQDGLTSEQSNAYQAVNPVSVSSDGIRRYWYKYVAGK